ncbi:hypothetical protein [Streptomyces spiramyceticus]|uniref:hypothetical protein n=1 Tax=Streptomyces spiramyceticus TaxID=299717 RepID=UPI00237C06FE|nr:hypothetical protein [Streptomyces spiramyceticus]
MLVWEVVRSNLSPGAREDWPWKLELLDGQTLGSLIAVGAGVVFARAQYARTARPILGRRSRWETGEFAARMRVTDAVGDSHERTMNLLKGAGVELDAL